MTNEELLEELQTIKRMIFLIGFKRLILDDEEENDAIRLYMLAHKVTQSVARKAVEKVQQDYSHAGRVQY